MPCIIVREETDADRAEAKEVSARATETLRLTYRPRKDVPAPARPPGASEPVRLVAILENRVVGVAKYWLHEDRIHVFGLGVHADNRRRGVAREVLEAVARIGRDHGAIRMSLFTIKETGNVDVFSKLGFHTVREQEDLYDESDHFAHLTDVYMERLL